MLDARYLWANSAIESYHLENVRFYICKICLVFIFATFVAFFYPHSSQHSKVHSLKIWLHDTSSSHSRRYHGQFNSMHKRYESLEQFVRAYETTQWRVVKHIAKAIRRVNTLTDWFHWDNCSGDGDLNAIQYYQTSLQSASKKPFNKIWEQRRVY